MRNERRILSMRFLCDIFIIFKHMQTVVHKQQFKLKTCTANFFLLSKFSYLELTYVYRNLSYRQTYIYTYISISDAICSLATSLHMALWMCVFFVVNVYVQMVSYFLFRKMWCCEFRVLRHFSNSGNIMFFCSLLSSLLHAVQFFFSI